MNFGKLLRDHASEARAGGSATITKDQVKEQTLLLLFSLLPKWVEKCGKILTVSGNVGIPPQKYII